MPDKYEVSFDGNEIRLPEQVEELFFKVRQYNTMIKNLEEDKKAIEAPLKKAMLKYGVDKFTCRYMTATTIKGSPYTYFDEEAMKRDGVYEKYARQLTKDDYVRITYKKVIGNE